jgi:hypothetical protein
MSETATASCYDRANEKLVGSMVVRSPVFVSPDGKYQAYTENEAVARQGSGLAECVNTARLFVQETGEDGFRLVFLQEPCTNSSTTSKLSIGRPIVAISWYTCS